MIVPVYLIFLWSCRAFVYLPMFSRHIEWHEALHADTQNFRICAESLLSRTDGRYRLQLSWTRRFCRTWMREPFRLAKVLDGVLPCTENPPFRLLKFTWHKDAISNARFLFDLRKLSSACAVATKFGNRKMRMWSHLTSGTFWLQHAKEAFAKVNYSPWMIVYVRSRSGYGSK